MGRKILMLGPLMRPNDGPLYVQYGAAYDSPADWLNFDSSPTLRLEKIPVVGILVRKNVTRFPKSLRYGDVLKGLPVADNSCAGVYASHVLEHLALNECRLALRNTYRMLVSGGRFRLIVPDLREYATRYYETPDAQAAISFMKATGLGLEEFPRTIMARLARSFGRSPHLWMWDYDSMHAELARTGFKEIRRCHFNDSVDVRFKSVERQDRFENAVAIECRK